MLKLRDVVLAAAIVLLTGGCGRKVDSRTKEGYDLVVAGKLDEAVALSNAILADDPKHTGAMNVLGLALYKSGDFKTAEETFKKALEVDPKHPEVHFNLGNVYLAMKRMNEAEVEFKAAIDSQGKFVLARYNLGKIYEHSGRMDQALVEYRKVVDLDPQFWHAHIDLGKIYEASGDFESAAASYQRVLELEPSFKEVHVRLGNSYFKVGGEENIKLAEESYRSAVDMDSTYVDALYSLGVLLSGQGREEEGTEWFRRALTASGDSADTEVVRIIRRYFRERGIPEKGPPAPSAPSDTAKGPMAT
jgi:tetratricopeptide (TPR) repeat protein